MTLRSLISAGALVTIGMLAGRILGMLREMLLAAQFGVSALANMAIALLIIPDFITAAFIGGAYSAVLLPAFASRSEERIQALLWQASVASAALFTAIAFICACLFSQSHDATAMFIAFCSMPLTAVTATFTAYLQYRERFMVPAFANAIFNVVILFTLWVASDNMILLASGIMAAGLLRLLFHYGAFLRAGGAKGRVKARWEIDRAMVIAYAHTVSGWICNAIPLYMPYAVVGALSAGFAAFNYAFKLLLFPASLAQTIVYMVLLPWFVKIRKNDPLASPAIYSNCLQIAWAITFAVGLCVSLASIPIAEICYGYGKMTQGDIALVGQLITVGIWATPGLAFISIWQQMLYTHEQAKSVMLANLVMAICIAPLCWLGYRLFDLHGVMAAYALSQLITFSMLVRLGKKHTGIGARPSFAYVRIAIAVIIAFVPLALVYHALGLGALPGVVVAIMIGMISAAAGLSQCPSVRKTLHECISHRVRLHR